MKPNEFIMNTDYLSIAQIDTNSYLITVGAGTLQPNSSTTQNFDFTIPARQGAIDRVLIKKDSQDYLVGSYMRFYIGNDPASLIYGYLTVYHSSKTNLRAELILWNPDLNNALSYPNMAFRIRVATFHPPNVF